MKVPNHVDNLHIFLVSIRISSCFIFGCKYPLPPLEHAAYFTDDAPQKSGSAAVFAACDAWSRVADCLRGYHSAFISFGAAHSGKTRTLYGSSSGGGTSGGGGIGVGLDVEDKSAGLVHGVLTELFEAIKSEAGPEESALIRCSFIEVCKFFICFTLILSLSFFSVIDSCILFFFFFTFNFYYFFSFFKYLYRNWCCCFCVGRCDKTRVCEIFSRPHPLAAS